MTTPINIWHWINCSDQRTPESVPFGYLNPDYCARGTSWIRWYIEDALRICPHLYGATIALTHGQGTGADGSPEQSMVHGVKYLRQEPSLQWMFDPGEWLRLAMWIKRVGLRVCWYPGPEPIDAEWDYDIVADAVEPMVPFFRESLPGSYMALDGGVSPHRPNALSRARSIKRVFNIPCDGAEAWADQDSAWDDASLRTVAFTSIAVERLKTPETLCRTHKTILWRGHSEQNDNRVPGGNGLAWSIEQCQRYGMDLALNVKGTAEWEPSGAADIAMLNAAASGETGGGES